MGETSANDEYGVIAHLVLDANDPCCNAERRGNSCRTNNEPNHLLANHLRFNPKYVLAACFHSGQRLGNPCICTVRIPEQGITQAVRETLPASVPYTQTDSLAWVQVTPLILGWILHRHQNGTLGPGACGRLTADVCSGYIQSTYEEDAIQQGKLEFAELTRRGCPAEAFPKLDPIVYDLVRFGLMRPWNGYSEWCKSLRPDDSIESPEPSQPSVPKPKRSSLSAKPRQSSLSLF